MGGTGNFVDAKSSGDFYFLKKEETFCWKVFNEYIREKYIPRIREECSRWKSKSSSAILLLLYSIFLFVVKILNVALYVSRRGMYACVRRWAIYVRPRGV